MVVLGAIWTWFNPRRRVLTFLLLAWGTVIVAAAGDTPAADRWLPIPDLSGVMAVLLVGSAFVGLVFFLILRPRVDRNDAEVPRHLLRSIALVLVAASTMTAIMTWGGDNALGPESESQETESTTEVDRENGSDVPQSEISPGEVLGVAAVAAAAVALWWWSRPRPDEATTVTTPGPRDARVAALDDTALALGTDTEPRRAVLVAYATLERELGRIGLERLAPETPVEYLRRVLADLPTVVEPASRLATLYVSARYSDQPISIADRTSALDDLLRARHDIASDMEPA